MKIIEGERQELAAILKTQIDAHGPFMHKALDLSFEVLHRLMLAEAVKIPEEIVKGGREGINMLPIFEYIEKESGVELDDETRSDFANGLFVIIARAGGMSICLSYEVAHMIEHMVYHPIH